MTQPIIRIINGDNVIDREMNEQEILQYEAHLVADSAHIKAEKEKAAQRQAILEKLGLTADEVAALLS